MGGGLTYDELTDTKNLTVKEINKQELITEQNIIEDVLKSLDNVTTTEEIKIVKQSVKKTIDILADLHNTGDDFLVQYLLDRVK